MILYVTDPSASGLRTMFSEMETVNKLIITFVVQETIESTEVPELQDVEGQNPLPGDRGDGEIFLQHCVGELGW